MRFNHILIVIDGLAALVALAFFVIGLADGTVSDFNGGLWTVLLVGVVAIVGGGIALDHAGQRLAAGLLLAVLAVPSVLTVAFILLVIILQPRWN